MKVTVDAEGCMATGMCVFTAPEVFDQSDDDGTVVLLAEAPAEDQHAAVREAARACPAQVISVIK
ncbi:ferredoxin [Streptomyces sp. XD-27]|uniref:ferredoxin n=1 Tax=Streptomyces sp. XD-27 TaxID=3062779 RepID=UPI0026F41A7C|nr:ferredoxin [Streptomyces sp. XD-27]WKX74100.1 ferredoxin [Streptomyces sp. XD-27]